MLLVGFVCIAAPAGAQTAGSLNYQAQLKVLQQQVDALQARLDGPGTFGHASVDSASEQYAGTIVVDGWGFACDYHSSKFVIEVDGTQSVQSEKLLTFYRFDRVDVRAAFTDPSCMAPAYAGFQTVVDMAPYANGPNGNGWHTVRLRVYDDITGKMATSSAFSVYVVPR